MGANNSLKAYKPHATDSGKVVDMGEGEKGLTLSYLVTIVTVAVDNSKNCLKLLDRYALIKV